MNITHRTAGSVAVVPTEPSQDQAFAGMPTENYRASYRAMLIAAPSEPLADLEATVMALRDCAEDLAAEIDARNQGGTRKYPSMEARYQRDMEPVRRARAALSAWELTDE